MDQVMHMSLFTPLDFSTKKPKLHNSSNLGTTTDHDHSDNDDNDNGRRSSHSIDMTDQEERSSITTAQSPCSQLRNILSMKSPAPAGAHAHELSSTLPDTTAALNLTMPQQGLEIGQNTRLWTATANSIPTDKISSPISSSKLRRRKQSDSRSLSDDDDDGDNDSGRSCTSSTSPISSNNSDCSYGVKKTSPQPPSTAHALGPNSTASQLLMNTTTANQHKSHYRQPNILNRHRQQQQQQLHFSSSDLKMESSPKLARKSSPASSDSQVQVVTPIATKLSPMHLNFNPYAAFSQAMSPMLSQSVPTSSFGLPIQFHTSSSLFPSSAIMTSSPSNASIKSENSLLTTFDNASLLSPNTSVFGGTPTTNATNGGGKSKTTRPFKAYPKDPLTFPAGLYGLPLSTPQPGSTESIIHQQSNNAYAEFRRQMLTQTPGKASKRLNQNHSQTSLGQQQQPTNLLSPISIPSLANPLTTSQQMQQIQQLLLASESPTNLASSADMLNYRLSLIERGSTSNGRPSCGRGRGGTNSSGAEDSHSNSDEGFGSNEKPRLANGANKSDQQLKDEAYWERRRKNNEAAKRSRDARRAKEDEIAIRAAFLEQENLKLRFEVCTLKHEIEKLKSMFVKR